jgi:hypothetical protein
MTTSAHSARRRKISRPSGVRRSTVTLRFPRLQPMKYALRWSPGCTGSQRD